MASMAALTSPPNWRASDSAIGISVVRYFWKMSLAAERSGRSILIFTSRRPGLNMAGGVRALRVFAAPTVTVRTPSTPPLSAREGRASGGGTSAEEALAALTEPGSHVFQHDTTI